MPLLEIKKEVLISDSEHLEHDSFLKETGNAAKLHSKLLVFFGLFHHPVF
jgi:hypothetical protein